MNERDEDKERIENQSGKHKHFWGGGIVCLGSHSREEGEVLELF
jgi:hypothetical protein